MSIWDGSGPAESVIAGGIESVASAVLAAADVPAAVASAFISLPEAVQDAVAAELQLSPDSHAREATQDEVDDFICLSDDAAVLVHLWGRKAAKKVGVFIARRDRLAQSIPEEHRETFSASLNKLTPEAQTPSSGQWRVKCPA